MRRLQQLLQSQIVFLNDILYFTFKKNKFTGRVAKGGLIWRCTWQKPGEEPQPVFSSPSTLDQKVFIRTFESLTDWTETCIQECLDEYHTRYSSWKRVRHQRTDQPMEILFKHLQKRQMVKEPNSGKQILLYEEIASQTHHIEQLVQTLDNWKEWFEQKYPGAELPIQPNQPEQTLATPSTLTPQTQPFVLTSDEGRFMVLHRMNEVAPPECISWLKTNGPTAFDTILKELPKIIQFEPAEQGLDTLNPVSTETSKRFVHNFFNT